MCASPEPDRGPGLALTTVLLVITCCSAFAAADSPQLLQEWPITGKSLPATVFFWHRDTPDIEAEAQADPAATYPGGLGVCSVHITRNPHASVADIQLNPLAHQSLGRGGVYGISLWIRASQPLTLEAAAIHDDPPFTPLGAGPAARLEAGPDWQEHHLTFTTYGGLR